MIFIISISICYSGLIFWLLLGIQKVKTFNPKNLKEKTFFSIVIPFRNEATSLPDLLNSIHKIDYPYPLFEVLLIDDDSIDSSLQIINNFKSKHLNIDLQIIKNNRTSKSPKKDAITTAIKKVKNEWIVTTDADCVLPIKWLKLFDEYIQANLPEFIVAPVTYTSKNNFLNAFQLLDIHSLQGLTIGTFGQNRPFLCNGANLAYRKDVFKKINGFSGNDFIASGDDVFLLEKVMKYAPKKVFYLKNNDVVVTTKAQISWYGLIQQRIRWAAKTPAYKNYSSKGIAILVLLINLSIIAYTIGFIFLKESYLYALVLIISKLIIDFLLLHKVARFFNQKKQLNFYLLSSLLYPYFSTYVAIKSLFFNYQWKGRTFNR